MSFWNNNTPPPNPNPGGRPLVATNAGWADPDTGELIATVVGLSTFKEPGAAPTLVRMYFDKAKYKNGDSLNVIAEFSEAVVVTGTPQVVVNLDGPTHTLSYASGSGTPFLTFGPYSITTDVATDGDNAITSPISLNGGTIKGNVNKAITISGTTGTFPVGAKVVGGTSAATGVVQRYDSTNHILYLVNVSGTFQNAETIAVSGSGATLGTPVLSTGSGFTGTAVTGSYQDKGAISPTTGGVLSVTVSAGGTLYTGSEPLVVFTPQGGDSITDPAVAHAVVEGGVITQIVMDHFGSGYVHTPLVSVTTGALISVPVTAAGSGYSIPPKVTVTDSGSGSGATASAVMVKDTVDHIVVNSNGKGYTTGTITVAIGVQGSATISAVGAPAVASLAFSTDPTWASVLIDGVAPTISTTTIPDGTYTSLSVIPITVVYSKTVFVVGKPTIELDFTDSSTSGNAVYSSGSGSTTLVFNYIVQAADAASLGDVNVNDITYPLNSSITDEVGNAAAIGTSATDTSNVAVNDVGAIVTAVSIAPGNYLTSATIPVVVTFNKNVYVTGVPTIAITTTGGTRTVNYASGSGSTALTFNYTVVSGDTVGAVSSAATSLTLGSGVFIQDSEALNATVTFSAPGTFAGVATNDNPTVSSAAFSNLTNGAHNPAVSVGDQVAFTLTMSKAATVTGTPRIPVSFNGNARFLNYASGSGSTSLVFSYTTVSGDASTAGQVTDSSASPVQLNSGTIKDALGIPFTLTFTAPNLSSVTVS